MAYDLNGIDQAINYIGSGATVQPAGDFSIFAWIRRGAMTSQGGVVSKTDSFFLHCVGTAGGQPRLAIRNASGGFENVQSSVGTTEGQWHHIGGTWELSTQILRVYVDAVETGSKVTSGPAAVTASDIQVGRFFAGGVTYGYVGEVARVSIYDQLLTAGEVSRERSFPGTQSPLFHAPLDAGPDAGSFAGSLVGSPILTGQEPPLMKSCGGQP